MPASHPSEIDEMFAKLDELKRRVSGMPATNFDRQLLQSLVDGASRSSAPSDEHRRTRLGGWCVRCDEPRPCPHRAVPSERQHVDGLGLVSFAELVEHVKAWKAKYDALQSDAIKLEDWLRMSAPLPVPAQEAEALIAAFEMAAKESQRLFTAERWDKAAFLKVDDTLAILRNDLRARLRSPSEIPDTALLDWLESEHARVDPVARLVVKRSGDRNSNDWADVSHDVRGTLQSLASPENSMAEQKLRQVRPHTVGSHYICGRCEKSHIVGCDANGLVGSLVCPNRPLASRTPDSSRSDTETSNG
jgi:hypothetical protein